VIEAMKDTDCVIDAYCGVGILACILAAGKKFAIGIDSVKENIDDAIFNAEVNQVQSKTRCVSIDVLACSPFPFSLLGSIWENRKIY
jgi:tRNA/tmRNA/rRNA uracil-C5-methylase (TrmA/RlmC/RlmD family)